jgi:hypothetical protein
LKDIVKHKEIDIKELKEEILSMDKELKRVGAGRHKRLNVNGSKRSKKSRRMRELAELSSSVIFKSLHEQSRRERNAESSARASNERSRDQKLERSWSRYRNDLERHEERMERSKSKQNLNIMNLTNGKKDEGLFLPDREGLDNWEFNWKTSLRNPDYVKQKEDEAKKDLKSE